MIRTIYILLLFSQLFGTVSDGKYWSFLNHNENKDGLKKNAEVLLDQSQFRKIILKAPIVSEQNKSSIIIEFPTPLGQFIKYKIVETPVLPEKLELKYPNIRTFSGLGVDNPNDRVSITLNKNTVKVLMLSQNGTIYISKNTTGNENYLVTFDEADIINGQTITPPHLNCSSEDAIMVNTSNDMLTGNREFSYCVGEPEPCFAIGDTLVTYRYAGILTAEANNSISDGTLEGGLAWIASMANQINLVWIRELSFRLELIENSDLLIYTDENPTPREFTDYDMGIELYRVHTFLYDVIGLGGTNVNEEDLLWEYGAVFNTGYAGGLAFVPGATSANLPSFAIHLHEIGHNLGSGHNCTSEDGWRSSFGGTAMCNAVGSLPGNYGYQYSSHTIDIAIRYQTLMTSGNGYDYQRGWRREETDNNIPIVELLQDRITIPKETAFVLEGFGQDRDEDNQLTFSWEQNDASEIAFSPPDCPPDTGPLFCSVDGNIDGYKRVFPTMESLLENEYSTSYLEQLPFASREINMRLLVRDNDLYSGGFNYKNVQLNVDGNAGPFRVTSQNNIETWEVGSIESITWDVANTNDPQGVNCLFVNILLSTDSGENFNIVLADNVVNNGSHDIIVPELPTLGNCRIMVQSVDNVFFDINNSFISINNSNDPEMSIDTSLISLTLSSENNYIIQREIENTGDLGSFLIYAPLIQLDFDGEGYLSFDGIDDYVDLGANMLSGDGDFSISLWVKSELISAVIIQQRNGGYNGEYQMRFNSTGKIDFWTYRNGSQWHVTSPLSYNDGIWHHVAVVQDGDINGGRLYVDGSEVDVSSDGIVYLDGAIHTYLGADMRDYENYLNGVINDVHIFNEKLSRIDIGTLFDNGFGFNPAYHHDGFNNSNFLVASYPMIAMSGGTLFDVTQNGHDGILSGPTWAGDLIPLPNWMEIGSESSWLSVGESEIIELEINTNDLDTGNEYWGDLIVTSNTDQNPITIPIQLNIMENNIQGDLNGDGVIDIQDLIILINMILVNEYSTLADLNEDGVVNILDITIYITIILNS